MFKEIIVRSPTFDPSRPSESSVSFLLIIAERYPYAVYSGLTPSSALLLLISILAACFTIGVTSSGRSRQEPPKPGQLSTSARNMSLLRPTFPGATRRFCLTAWLPPRYFTALERGLSPRARSGAWRAKCCVPFTHARRHGTSAPAKFFLSSGCQALRLICTYIACATSCPALSCAHRNYGRSLTGRVCGYTYHR